MALEDIKEVSPNSFLENLKKPAIALKMSLQHMPSTTIKYNANKFLFLGALRGMGTERHSCYIEEADEGKVTKI